MKNLNYLKIIFFSVVFFATTLSCNEDQLEIRNPNQISQDGFFQAESNYRLAVNGMFHPITTVLCWGRVIHTGPFLRSDAYNVVPFQENTTMSTFQSTAGISRWSQDLYAQFYLAISRANDVINAIDEDNLVDDEARDEIAGQAYFVRAFAYWYLVNFWGDVPLILENPQDSSGFFPSRTAAQAVNESIISDLTIASERLPSQWDQENLGRPTSGSALALRGKTHLYAKNYTEAINDLSRVTTEFNYALLPASSYQDNFNETNENNEESVFELQYLGQETFAWGSDVPGTGTQGNYFIDYAPPTLSPDQGHFINPHILQVFEDNGDTVRRNATIAFDYPGATGYGGLPFSNIVPRLDENNQTETDCNGNIIMIDTGDFGSDIRIANGDPNILNENCERTDLGLGIPALFTRKYAAFDEGVRESIPNLGNTIGINWRVIRYSDVLLMLAEALNAEGRTAEAIPYINMVRERAQITPLATILSQEDTEQAIIDERIMELTGEGHRFLDLVRWGIADEVLGPNSTIADGRHPKSLSGGSFRADRDNVLWIPVPELQANPNLTQNPGY